MKRRSRSRGATTSSRWRRRRSRRARPRRTTTAGRLLDRSASLEDGRLAAGCGHRVGLVALLDGDDVAGDADDLEGTVVGGGERRGLLITPDENESSARREVDWGTSQAGAVVSGGDRLLGGYVSAEVPDELGGRRRGNGGQTTSGNGKRRAQHKIGGRGVQICFDGGSEAKQDPWQLIEPV